MRRDRGETRGRKVGREGERGGSHIIIVKLSWREREKKKTPSQSRNKIIKILIMRRRRRNQKNYFLANFCRAQSGNSKWDHG